MNSKKSLIGTAIAVVLAIILMVFATPSKAETLREEIDNCTTSAIWKAYGWSALYGGAVLGGVTAISVMGAPVTTGVAVGAVVINTITGSALGAGSSAITRISDMNNIGKDNIAAACANKIAREKIGQTKEIVKKGVEKGIEKTEEILKSDAYNSAKKLLSN